MRRFASALLAVAILSLPLAVAAQQAQQSPPGVPVRDPLAVALVQKCLAAMGGANAPALQNSQAAGTIRYSSSGNPVSAPLVIKSKGTKLVRWEIQAPEGARVRFLNQGQAVIQAPNGKVRRLSETNTLAERANHIPVLSLLSEWADPSVELHYIGAATVNERPVVGISMSTASSPDPVTAERMRMWTRTLFFFDQGTGVLLKMQFQNFAEDDDRFSQKVELLFGDYRTVNGVLVPFKQDRFEDGHLAFSLVLNSIAFNVGISDSDFTLPVAR